MWTQLPLVHLPESDHFLHTLRPWQTKDSLKYCVPDLEKKKMRLEGQADLIWGAVGERKGKIREERGRRMQWSKASQTVLWGGVFFLSKDHESFLGISMFTPLPHSHSPGPVFRIFW